METRIIPLSSPVVNWMEYLNTSSGLLRRSITASLDAKRLPVGDLAAFISTLAELRREGSHPEYAVREFSSLRKHIFFSFMVVGDGRLESELRNLDLTVTSPVEPIGCTVAVVSGTLDQWQRAISETLSSKDSIKDIRVVFGNLYRFFVSQGLASLWPPKFELPDGTFLLAYKER